MNLIKKIIGSVSNYGSKLLKKYIIHEWCTYLLFVIFNLFYVKSIVHDQKTIKSEYINDIKNLQISI